jgi:hypothetical protein
MSSQAEHADERPPPTVPGLKGEWYRTLDEAIHAWALKQKPPLHGPAVVPEIKVYLHSHVGGWNVG